jgi:hypothetical protein
MDWEKALEVASRVTHPIAVAAIALVFAAFAFFLAHRARKPGLTKLLASIVVALGLAPLAAFTFLQSRGIYRVQIVVQLPDQQPASDASLKSSVGGEMKKADGRWELAIPPQVRPADRKVTLYASRADAFQAGNTTIELNDDYYPIAIIQLTSLPPVMIRGMVKDEQGKSVRQAHVSVPGYHDYAVTDLRGNFELPSHAAQGQMISVHAEKGDLVADVSVPAGTTVELVLRRNR